MMTKEKQISVFDIEGIEDKKGHGGSRKGAGRKKGEPTKLIRICEDIEPELKQISEYYKTLSPIQKEKLKATLSYLPTCIK